MSIAIGTGCKLHWRIDFKIPCRQPATLNRMPWPPASLNTELVWRFGPKPFDKWVEPVNWSWAKHVAGWCWLYDSTSGIHINTRQCNTSSWRSCMDIMNGMVKKSNHLLSRYQVVRECTTLLLKWQQPDLPKNKGLLAEAWCRSHTGWQWLTDVDGMSQPQRAKQLNSQTLINTKSATPHHDGPSSCSSFLWQLWHHKSHKEKQKPILYSLGLAFGRL